MDVDVKVFNSSDLNLPVYATPGAAGMDVYTTEDVEIHPGETKLVPTGIHVQIPAGYEIQVRPRSGVSFKTDLLVANSPGTVDSDYRGEIKVIMKNVSYSKVFKFNRGERVAQIVLQAVPTIIWYPVVNVESLDDTTRGVGGFGSTGA